MYNPVYWLDNRYEGEGTNLSLTKIEKIPHKFKIDDLVEFNENHPVRQFLRMYVKECFHDHKGHPMYHLGSKTAFMAHHVYEIDLCSTKLIF